jgi:probable HAF family extracellular repeat protein
LAISYRVGLIVSMIRSQRQPLRRMVMSHQQQAFRGKAIVFVLSAATMLSLPALGAAGTSAAYQVQQIDAPGAALRMSAGEVVVGMYQVKCVKVSTRPPREACYSAPWYYDGAVTKVAWPSDWNLVTASAINEARQLVGWEYHGTVYTGGWLYDAGTLTYSGNLSGGTGSSLVAVNNHGVAAGTGRNSFNVVRPVIFSNGYLSEVPVFDAHVPATGNDINDAGDIVGNFIATDGTQHAYAYSGAAALAVPDLPGSTACWGTRISPSKGWVAVNCTTPLSQWGMLYNLNSQQAVHLLDFSGAETNTKVSAVNSDGTAVGLVGTKMAVWRSGSSTAIDLSSYAGKNAAVSTALDVNDAGTILAQSSSGSIPRVYLLRTAP